VHPSQHQQTKPQNMTTKSKKQTSTTSRKKKLTVKKETLRDLNAGEKGRAVRGGAGTYECGASIGL
jgi:hypothetical protein